MINTDHDGGRGTPIDKKGMTTKEDHVRLVTPNDNITPVGTTTSDIHHVTPVNFIAPGSMRESSNGFWIFCRIYRRIRILIVITAISLFFLLGLSSEDEVLILIGGETRQVHTGILNKELQVTSYIPDGVHVYTFARACPPLTGPTFSLDQSRKIAINAGTSDLKSIYLNKGSGIAMSFTLQSGASFQLLLLEGKYVNIQDIMPGDQNVKAQQMLQDQGQSANITFTAQVSDYYTLVTKNEGDVYGMGQLEYNLDVQTHDLSGQTPISCDNSTLCSVNLLWGQHGCILVQANELVTVHVTVSHMTVVIILLALIPLGIIGYWFYWSSQRREQMNSSTSQRVEMMQTAHVIV